MFLVSFCSCLNPIRWSQVLSPEWRCSWRLSALLQLHLSDQQFDFLLECILYQRLDGIFFQPLPNAFSNINTTCAWFHPNRSGYTLMECLLPFWYSIETPLSCATAIYIYIRWAWSIAHICDIYIISTSIVFIIINGRAEQYWNGGFRFSVSPWNFHLLCDDDAVFMHR